MVLPMRRVQSSQLPRSLTGKMVSAQAPQPIVCNFIASTAHTLPTLPEAATHTATWRVASELTCMLALLCII